MTALAPLISSLSSLPRRLAAERQHCTRTFEVDAELWFFLLSRPQYPCPARPVWRTASASFSPSQRAEGAGGTTLGIVRLDPEKHVLAVTAAMWLPWGPTHVTAPEAVGTNSTLSALWGGYSLACVLMGVLRVGSGGRAAKRERWEVDWTMIAVGSLVAVGIVLQLIR